MKRRSGTPEEVPPKVPGYIVTFSDMVTLLLTFFVLLISMATMQSAELFHAGQHSFLRSIRMLGLGMLPGAKQTPDFGEEKIKHFISKPDEKLVVRTIDAKEEEIRRLFKRLARTTTAMPSQIVAKTTKFSITDIRFSPGDATLDEAAKRFLTEFCLNLRQGTVTEKVRFYVLGLASEGATWKEQWLLSARRAQAVAEFLNDALPSELEWPVYSWGAGPGGHWVSPDSPISKQLHILIAVLRAND